MNFGPQLMQNPIKALTGTPSPSARSSKFADGEAGTRDLSCVAPRGLHRVYLLDKARLDCICSGSSPVFQTATVSIEPMVCP